MNRGPIIFIGLFLAMCYSWYGFIYKNFMELGHQEPEFLEDVNANYPGGRSGIAKSGQDVYRANGCSSCHTMQVRPANYGADIPRFGKRLTVMQDFLYDQQVFLGSVRIGPDLANVGARQASPDWHFTHLYSPRSVVPGSTMPHFRYLFEKRKIRGTGSPDAVKLTQEFAPEPGFEIIPKPEAKALVAYLTSLKAEASLFEAPIPKPRPPGGGDTNSPTSNATSPVAPPQQ